MPLDRSYSTELTPYQTVILKMTIAGYTQEHIGKLLGTSKRSVENQWSAACSKLGALTRHEAFSKAAQMGICLCQTIKQGASHGTAE